MPVRAPRGPLRGSDPRRTDPKEAITVDAASTVDGGTFGGEQRKWWTLGAVSLGLFMIMLDNTVVNVALPSIERDLGMSLSQLEWVVTGYALTFAAFMLTGGKLADLLGRRLVFVAGLAVFTAASLACGLAGGADMLIGARARHRPARRRPSLRARRLELDLLRQRPGRRDRDRRGLPVRRRVARHLAEPAAGRAGARHVRDRPLRAHLRADRGEQPRVGID